MKHLPFCPGKTARQLLSGTAPASLPGLHWQFLGCGDCGGLSGAGYGRRHCMADTFFPCNNGCLFLGGRSWILLAPMHGSYSLMQQWLPLSWQKEQATARAIAWKPLSQETMVGTLPAEGAGYGWCHCMVATLSDDSGPHYAGGRSRIRLASLKATLLCNNNYLTNVSLFVMCSLSCRQ